MTESRKKLGAASWAIMVVLLLLLLYVAGVGPAFWFAERRAHSGDIKTVRSIERVYTPLFLMKERAPPAISSPLDSYVCWWRRLALRKQRPLDESAVP
jgi:hypothetical protein